MANCDMSQCTDLLPAVGSTQCWKWMAVDCSENQLTGETFGIFFETDAFAAKFKIAFDDAKAQSPGLFGAKPGTLFGKPNAVKMNEPVPMMVDNMVPEPSVIQQDRTKNTCVPNVQKSKKMYEEMLARRRAAKVNEQPAHCS